MKILFWGDFPDRHVAKRIMKTLATHRNDIEYEIMNAPSELKQRDLSDIYAVILMVTDVTKFSTADDEREEINDILDDYVSDGGRLITTHDVLYRRCRNIRLREIFNYETYNFQRIETPVIYRKSKLARTMKAFDSIPDLFKLEDGEVTWGDIKSDDLKVFFETNFHDGRTGRRMTVPVCLGRNYGDGTLLWFNTGDTMVEAPKSASVPDMNMIRLISCLLDVDLRAGTDRSEAQAAMLARLPSVRPDEPYIFISYCSQNAYRVYANAYILSRLGVNIWLDRKNITTAEPGSDGWKEAAITALDNCAGVIIGIDETFLGSMPCEEEVRRINEKKKLPIVILGGLECQDLIDIMNSWNGVESIKKLETYSELLCIHDKRIDQITYLVGPTFEHLKEEQFLNTLIKLGVLKMTTNEARAIIQQVHDEFLQLR